MQYYNEISKGYNGMYAEEQLAKIKIIKENIEIDKNTQKSKISGVPEMLCISEHDKILDVGCGSGILTFNNFFVGIDPSIELLKINKNKNKINGTGEFLPFKDNSFDTITSITSLHNFKDIEKGINEIKRVGKKNFIFSVLKRSKKFELMKNLIYAKFIIYKKIDEEKDIIFFTIKKIKYH